MGSSRMGMIKILQKALDEIGVPVLYHTTQFYSVAQKRAITQYHIKKVYIDTQTGKSGSDEIFSTYNQMYIIFFLRDLLDYIRGIELDTSNDYWEAYKEKYNVNVEDVMKL